MINFDDIIRRGNDRNRIAKEDAQLLYKTASGIKARNILEIGSADGTSSMVLATVAKENNGHLFCVEARPTNVWHKNINELKLEDWVTMINAWSPWVDDSYINYLIDNPIDFLFIDGDHKTSCCITDYWYWKKFVRKGGLIAFHDIFGPPGPKVNRALSIIIEDNGRNLREIARTSVMDVRGTVVYENLV